MFGILSNEPWFPDDEPLEWLSPPEFVPSWDSFWQDLRQTLPLLVWVLFAALGGWLCTHRYSNWPGLTDFAVGSVGGGVVGFYAVYGAQYLVELARERLRRFIDNLNPFGP